MNPHEEQRPVEDRLRSSLRREADALPYARDLTEPTLARARGIRRRRRVAGGVAAVAAVALTVPVGLRVGADVLGSDPAPVAQQPTGDPQVSLDLSALPTGAAPSTPWSERRTAHLGGANVQLPESPDGLERSLTGAVPVFEDGRGFTLIQPPDAEMLSLQSDNSALDSVASAPSGAYTAAVSSQLTDQGDVVPDAARVLWVHDASATAPDADVGVFGLPLDGRTRVVAVGEDGSVVLQPEAGRQPALLVDDGETTELEVSELTAWSFTADLLATITEVSDFGSCSDVRRTDETGQVGETAWSTCDWQISGFSPDGRWAYGTPAYADGYGPTAVAVLDASSGEVVRTLRFGTGQRHPGTFMDAAWESEDTLLLRVESDDGRTALVRLDVLTGAAELAAGPVPFDGFNQFGPPPLQIG